MTYAVRNQPNVAYERRYNLLTITKVTTTVLVINANLEIVYSDSSIDIEMVDVARLGDIPKIMLNNPLLRYFMLRFPGNIFFNSFRNKLNIE